jgi:hypothetical protein
MTEGDQVDDPLLQVELVNDAIIANPQTEVITAFEAMMGKSIETRSYLIKFLLDLLSNAQGKLIELLRINLFGCAHMRAQGLRTRVRFSVISRFPRSMLALNSSVNSC